MKELALGLIETVGFIPAVEAADTAAKTSEVTITGVQKVGRGLVTVVITGDLSPVQAAVDSGCDAAALLGKVHSATVIARQAEGLPILMEKRVAPKEAPSPQENSSPQEGNSSQKETLPATRETRPEQPTETRVEREKQDFSRLGNSQLQRKKVADLRAILHAIQDGSWEEAEIDTANKRKLIMMIKRVVNNQ